MAELAAGPHATGDAGERARRQDRLQRAEAVFDPLPFDGDCARAYGRIYAAVVTTGRKARGPRAFDLLIAATAVAANLALYTRNVDDFRGIEPRDHRRCLTHWVTGEGCRSPRIKLALVRHSLRERAHVSILSYSSANWTPNAG
jgi:hypothetical protein